jgi:hypothetical protein
VNFDHHEVQRDVCKWKNKKHKAHLDDVNEFTKCTFIFFTSVLLKSRAGLVVLLF